MKRTIGPITLDISLPFRLWWPAAAFFVLCTCIFLAFGVGLRTLDQIAPSFMRNGWYLLLLWLALLIFYIILGIAFIRFVAYYLRRSFGLKELRFQRWMAILSGFPLYCFCLLCLFLTIYGIYINTDPASVYASGIGFVGFCIISCIYLLLLRFFLRRSTTAIAHQ